MLGIILLSTYCVVDTILGARNCPCPPAKYFQECTYSTKQKLDLLSLL